MVSPNTQLFQSAVFCQLTGRKMSARVRRAICDKISQVIKLRPDAYYELELPARRPQSATAALALHWTPASSEPVEELLRLIPTLQFDEQFVQSVRVLPAVGKTAAKLEFQLQPQALADSLLPTSTVSSTQRPAHVVLDFSSPNIAKPFHVGHLRSTIIGNVLANLHQQLGYRVTRLNYLGDWGTQFGMLQVGVEMQGVTDAQMRSAPIETLYRAYVAANAAAKTDDSIVTRARQCFADLESNSNAAMAEQWQQYRRYTVEDLSQMYARLGVHFDLYEWESQYSQQQIGDVLESLQQRSLLLDEEDGRKVVQVDGRRVPLIKSDGSTLYLARDVAALVDRFQRLQFERMLYVVENGQSDHFNALFKTTAALCDEIPLTKLQHVKFGRIHGMSTRTGSAVFLRDVLDEASEIMLLKQLKSPTTKVTLSNECNDYKNVADVLGVSAVIINDLKQRRQRDYNFDWQKALQVNGDTGIKLQYTHCRLHSLLEQADDTDAHDWQPAIEHLAEPEAQALLYELARFDHVVWQAKEQLEACILVNYLFALCNATSRALKHLNVKNERSCNKRNNRILLFDAVKRTLNTGMRLLGLKPLNQM